MRSVYLGTSGFAATILRALAESPYAPTLVVAPPDRPSGRGRKVHPPPVASAAVDLGLELHQTADVNSEESLRAVLAVEPAVATVCAFGQLIREPLLSAVPMLNIHPSLLPRWRGAAPVERAIMAGDPSTGVCVMQLTAGLDSGPVALREEVAIGPFDDYGSLAAKLATAGAALMIEALGRQERGELELTEQPDTGITYAEKIESAERRVDTSGNATSEALRVRGLTPHIGAFVSLDDQSRIGIRDVVAIDGGGGPGRFAPAEDGKALLLGLGDGGLRISTLQPPGKRWMAAGDYLRGYGVPGRPEPDPTTT